MSHFPPYCHRKNKFEVELDLSNYATKSELKHATGVDISKFAKTDYLANVVDKLQKSEKLDVDMLAPVPTDLRKLSNVVKNDVVKEDVYNAKIKNIRDKNLILLT